MKILTFLAAIAVMLFSGYYFTANLRYSTDLNYILYESMWLVLILISAVGIMYNFPNALRRKKAPRIIYNSYSLHRIQNKRFDSEIQIFGH